MSTKRYTEQDKIVYLVQTISSGNLNYQYKTSQAPYLGQLQDIYYNNPPLKVTNNVLTIDSQELEPVSGVSCL